MTADAKMGGHAPGLTMSSDKPLDANTMCCGNCTNYRPENTMQGQCHAVPPQIIRVEEEVRSYWPPVPVLESCGAFTAKGTKQ